MADLRGAARPGGSVPDKGKEEVTRVLNRRRGIIHAVSTTTDRAQELVIEVEGQLVPGINYRDLAADVYPGDLVELNTTAVDLGLGTGGVHFVIGRLSPAGLGSVSGDPATELRSAGDPAGHIMKLRYTPLQVALLSAEEEQSPHHGVMQAARGLEGMPVVVAGLHSLIAPIAVVLKQHLSAGARITYLMTDGGALPLGFSRLAASLRERGFISSTVTVGHAFGGDLEAVNIYSGLLAGRHILQADVCVVAMGPGVVGTATPFGTTAMEVAAILDGVNALGGRAIAAARVSFADGRPRHRGISHHTLTALHTLCYSRCCCPLPVLSRQEDAILREQSREYLGKHEVVFVDHDETLALLARHGVSVTSMGRAPHQDPAFFRAGGAAGWYAAQLLIANCPPEGEKATPRP